MFLLFLVSCVNKNKYFSKFETAISCGDKWIYQDFKSIQAIKILHFEQKFKSHNSATPNLIIGVNINNDTIGLVDLLFEDKLHNDDSVLVGESNWTKFEKDNIRVQYIYSYDKKIRALYCKLHNIYYGKILAKL